MNRSSIFYIITFVFILTGVSVVLAFLWLIKYDQQNYTNELNNKYSLIANVRIWHLKGLIDENQLKERTKNYDSLKKINIPKEIREVFRLGEVLYTDKVDNGIVQIISYKQSVYLNIIYNGVVHLYKDEDYQGYRYVVFKIISVVVICIIILLYAFVLKKIKPLRTLKIQIDKFAQGKLNEIKNISTGFDEISQVGDAFYQATRQIEKLNQSRHFFIRNMMHELKTPITKGLITLEMLEDTKYKERLANIFNRLEILINEFAAIEQITSGATFINRKKYNILDILDESKEIAMIDESNVQIFMNESFFVNVDFKLFTTAIKNMIDNAIKYSQDKFLQIYIKSDFICFKNKGNKLNNSLEYYTQAFTQGSKQKDSFGLGLYIVSTILETHGMKLTYEYKDEMNLFYFNNLNKIRK
ncbi:HAMP domain-containing histidine kinase [Campylobacter sp. LR291e]|uniref:ArsS family sensor histidine kinase n=1 Tax=Campylobacter sp. LR291e TaxID=2593546 RepID=UPI00123B9074|nr:ArsS family sensor histidine kinase [Campylobacter sp. LR291e]KAA6234278.1 HAMP domain-containing histidine kinase [Campylobacter sp. LR291e]